MSDEGHGLPIRRDSAVRQRSPELERNDKEEPFESLMVESEEESEDEIGEDEFVPLMFMQYFGAKTIIV